MRRYFVFGVLIVLFLVATGCVLANDEVGTVYDVNSSYVRMLDPGQQPGPGTITNYYFSGLTYPYNDLNAADYFGVQKMLEFAEQEQSDLYCYVNSGGYQSSGGSTWLRYAQLLKITPQSEAGSVWGYIGKVVGIVNQLNCIKVELMVTEPAVYSGTIIRYYVKNTNAEPANDGIMTMLQFALDNSSAYDVYINATLVNMHRQQHEYPSPELQFKPKQIDKQLKYAQLLRADTSDIATVAIGYVGKVLSMVSQNGGATFNVEILVSEPANYAGMTVNVVLENDNGWVHCEYSEMLEFARDNQDKYDVYINQGGYLPVSISGPNSIQYAQLLRTLE